KGPREPPDWSCQCPPTRTGPTRDARVLCKRLSIGWGWTCRPTLRADREGQGEQRPVLRARASTRDVERIEGAPRHVDGSPWRSSLENPFPSRHHSLCAVSQYSRLASTCAALPPSTCLRVRSVRVLMFHSVKVKWTKVDSSLNATRPIATSALRSREPVVGN